MDFTWDAKKAVSNPRKHDGVTFEEAATVFVDPLAKAEPDDNHEERMVLLGLSSQSRTLFVVYAEWDEDLIRIISARLATSHERRRHEEGY